MSIAEPWDRTPMSDARLNKMTIPVLTGDDIDEIDKTKFKIVICSADGGSGYLKDHVYEFSEDTPTPIEYDLSVTQSHTHQDSDTGGALSLIHVANPEVIDLVLLKQSDLLKAQWNQTVTGTGTIEDGGGGTSKSYIRLRPNGTSGSGSTISYTYALDASWGFPFIFAARGNFETASNLAFHAGVDADDITAADSNTKKIQAEVCTVTNSNWWLRTADGSANSASDIGVAINTNTDSIKLVHNPFLGTPADILNISTTSDFTKTTNIATSGQTTTGNIIKFSIKNNTGEDRPYRMGGCRLSFVTESAWAYG